MDRRCRLREYRDFRREGRDRRPAFDRILRDASRRKFDVVMSIAALERLAGADAFRPSLGLARREAVWAIRALRDRPLPLFEAAETCTGTPIAEVSEPAVVLRPMKAGREVVEDYNATGLTLRPHPVFFLRRDLAARSIVACAEASYEGCVTGLCNAEHARSDLASIESFGAEE